MNIKSSGFANIVVIFLALAVVLGAGTYVVLTKKTVLEPSVFDERSKEIFLRFYDPEKSFSILLSRGNNAVFEELRSVVYSALQGRYEGLENHLGQVKAALQDATKELADAPDLRGATNDARRVCIAEALATRRLSEVVSLCGFGDSRPQDVSFGEIDDITSLSRVLPYFLAGLAYRAEGDREAAEYYFRQVVRLRRAGIEEWGASSSFFTEGDFQEIVQIAESYSGVSVDTAGISSLPPSLPTSCIDESIYESEGVPVITSLSQYSGPVGTELEIRGCNFSGFEGDKNAWIESSEGVRGILYGHLSGVSTSKLIKVILSSPLCSNDPSYAGTSCAEFAKLRGEELKMLYLVPGKYKIYVEPWGKRSNEVNFIITE